MGNASGLPSISLAKDDRVLVLAPHPDDETIATGGIIQQAVAMGLPVHVAWLTNGDNNETSFIAYHPAPALSARSVRGMGLVRHDEAVAAAGALGLRPDQLTFFGYPDFRTLVIWNQHWGAARPCESMFTRTKVVPYANASRPGAPHKGEEILADVEAVLRDFRPTVVFVSHPGDHNPDHQSLYLFTRVALWNLASEIKPALRPYLVHHPEWPQPDGYHPELALTPPDRLANQAEWSQSPVAGDTAEQKRRALSQHVTQYRFDKNYLDSFIRANELFGDLPWVDLGQGMPPAGPQAVAEGLAPAQLTHAEQASYVGIERRRVWLEDGQVVVSVDYSGKVGAHAGLAVSCFGYRSDRPFVEMPKIQVRIGAVRHGVYDQDRKLSDAPVEMARHQGEVVVRIPLELLGGPERILGAARSYLGAKALDWIAWRVLEVPADAG
jgi:LmbE family N-acetylglucosaminyl deacetylase